MTNLEQSKAAKEFANFWRDKGYEKGQSQTFWLALLSDVLGIINPKDFIDFEVPIKLDNTSFIDGYIEKTHVLIEQKSISKDLRKPIAQSDGSLLNPFQQAKRYSAELPYDKKARWIVTCNFKSFLIYDMNNPNSEPEEILLENLEKEYYRLSFLIDLKNEHIKKEEELSIKAGELVGILYDSFSKQYKDLTKEQSSKDLNELCVRLVFCLYAEDAGLFGRKNVFYDYLNKYNDLTLMRKALIDLFKILDTPLNKRDPYLEDDLNQFPYVNGGLFSNENIEIPTFTQEIRNILLSKASDEFDWSEISPTIFGAVFESTLNQDTRRSGGMHYTSIENIHKVIDPLFLNDLRDKLNEAESCVNEKTRNKKLIEFQNYISNLNFLDPACGSGNFLTESYLSLRRLENEILSVMSKGSMMLDVGGIVKVSINQFYGIEINDFAVKVAKTALWIAEAQMWSETCKLISSNSSLTDFLPLDSYDNITEGNALRIDWNNVISNSKCDYIMGNPPFVGARLMNESQKLDLNNTFINTKNSGNLDYVSCWYKLSYNYIKNTHIKVALVSTNSITQGEQSVILWKPLMDGGLKINFCHKTFRWDSEASIKAHVHCVIVGFSFIKQSKNYIYDNGKLIESNNINAYLCDAPTIFISNRTNPLNNNVPKMDFGSMPNDGGFLSNYSQEDYDNILKLFPNSINYFKRIYGADEFINNKIRYCLWLNDIEPHLYRNNPIIMDAIKNVYKIRFESKREATKKLAEVPYLFGEIRQPNSNYLLIPSTSSERRRYVPIGFMSSNNIATNANLIIPNASIYIFGILTSNVHMSWMRAIAGRLKSDYRYSAKIVYNNFPWPEPTKEQKKEIEKTAQMILDARAEYHGSSLSDLYDELTMPPKLRHAHQRNDIAVIKAYGWDVKNLTESDCVSKLMELYEKITEEEK